jgi:hypothetical protein
MNSASVHCTVFLSVDLCLYITPKFIYPCVSMKCKGGFFLFFLFIYDIQHCFICRPSYWTVSEDAGIEPRAVANRDVAVIRSNHSALNQFLGSLKV